MLALFRSAINGPHPPHPAHASLEIDRSGALSVCYAPFDYINSSARVVLLGMTPGAQQADNALRALRVALVSGDSEDAALKSAKTAASFSGPMRKNLVGMLDRIGLHGMLGLESCVQLFTTHAHLVHFTSAVRYPVFVGGKNYTGSPGILRTPFLAGLCDRWLAEEVEQLSSAFWIPLGKEAQSVINHFAARGRLDPARILDGLPHPSPANAERIAYFLGKKLRARLCAKTNPDQIEAAREKLIGKVSGFSGAAPLTRSTAVPTVPKKAASLPEVAAKSAVLAAGAKDRRAERFAKTFFLEDARGNPRFPIRNRRGYFVLAPRGANTHHAEYAIHIEVEEDAYEMVQSGTYKIRAVRSINDPASLLGTGDRAIARVVRVRQP